MGLKDRLTAAKRHLWSPMTVWMADQGCDELVHAGAPARVVVDVRGEDDGTAAKVVVGLQMIGWGSDGKERWLLAELPPELGRHELEVQIPTGLAPACGQYAEYSFTAELVRTKGVSSAAAAVVDVVARPEDLYWPEGPRSGGDAPVAIELDAPAPPPAHQARQLPGQSQPQPQPRARFSAAAEVSLEVGERLELPFMVDLPEGLPPTLHNGGQTSVVWQVRVKYGKTSAWRIVGVLDPEGTAGRRGAPSPSLLAFLSSFDAQR